MIREAVGRGLVRHRWPALFTLLLLTAMAVFGIHQRLQQGMPIDFTPQAIFIDRGPMLDRLQEIDSVFGREDNDLLLIVDGQPLRTDAGRQVIEQMHATMAADPDVVDVFSLVDAMLLESDDGMLIVSPLLEDRSMAQALQHAVDDPYLSGMLVSPDQQTTVIRVRIRADIHQVAELAPVVHRLTEQAHAVDLPDDMSLLVTGVPFVRTEVVDMMIADEAFFIPVTGIMFAITICFLFRRVLLGLGPLFAVQGAVVWAMGVLLAMGATLNILSILIPVLVLVIGVADGIHLVGRYREDLATFGDPETAMGSTFRHMTVACFLTTFTTAAGFASLMVADTRVIQDFGLHSAIAVMTTFFGVMFILPVWLAFLPAHRVGPPPTERPGASQQAFLALDRLVARRPVLVLLGCLVLTAIAGGVGSSVRPNSRMLEMYHPDHPTWAAITHTEQQLAGVVPIFIHFEATAGDLLDPQRLQKIAAIEAELQEWDMVRWTSSLPSAVQHIHHTLTGEDTLPPSREAVAQELLLAEMAGDLPLDKVTNADNTQVRILAFCTDAGGREFTRMHQAMEAFATEALEGEPITVDVTGDGLIASLGVGGLINDLLASIGLVFVVILMVMGAMLRDVKLAILAAVPNIAPLVFTLAALAVMGADLQTSNIVSFTVAIGLAVDDTIHFLVRYRQERDAGHDHAEAIRRTFLGAGHAIVLTSMLLVIGFALLSTSTLTTTRHFGILSSVTMVAAVLADLFLLPALLHLAVGGRRQPAPTS